MSATGYELQRSTEGGNFHTIANLASSSSRSYTDTGLLRGISYCYRVRAYNAVGQSPYSAVRCDEIRGDYTASEIEYFRQVAFGSEFTGARDYIVKWSQPTIRVSITGGSAIDRQEMEDILAELASISGSLKFLLTTGTADLEVYIGPLSTLSSHVSEYVPGNWGFFYIEWDSSKRIVHGWIAVADDVTTVDERLHLLREETTQALGLMNDSWSYSKSLFYQGWTSTTEYAPIDHALIEMLYRPEIYPGMPESAAIAVLGGI